MNPTTHRTTAPSRYALIPALLALFFASLATTAGAATSAQVAYVTEFGAGSGDIVGPPSIPGSSIFVNALTGLPPFGSYTTTDGTKTVTVIDVAVASLETSSNPKTALAGFDTVILYQVCGIGSLPNTMIAINSFLLGGGKVLIFDADRCSSLDGFPAAPAYANFVFPFTVSRLGPKGTTATYTNVQPSTLTSGLVVGPQAGDALPDANILTTFNGAWCGSITATATGGTAGFVQAYARTPSGGLVIYAGEDFWFTAAPSAHLREVFDLMLRQDWNPDGLACALPGSGIALTPVTQRLVPGDFVGLTATVVDANGIPLAGVPVVLAVTAGPNAGNVSAGQTDGAGHLLFVYRDGGLGTDTAVVTFVDGRNQTHVSNTASVVWGALNTPPVALCTNVTMPTTPGLCAAPASVNNGSFDPDPGDTITVTQSPAGPYGAGTTTVTLTVTDSKGASSTCTGTVTVVDSEPPKLTCPAPITVECASGGSAAATLGGASAQDNCGATVMSCSGSGTSFPLGATTVMCTATDIAKNTSSCSTTVTVVDTRPPTVTCVPSGYPSGAHVSEHYGHHHHHHHSALYKVSANDLCSAPTMTFGGVPLKNGETIKITRRYGKPGVTLENKMGRPGIKHFLVGPGDARIVAKDAAGNDSSAVCPLPPRGYGDRKRHEAADRR